MLLFQPFYLLLIILFTNTTENEFFEKKGLVIIEAENYSSMKGNWKKKVDQGTVSMRMNGPDGNMFEGRHMYLAYQINFTKPDVINFGD